MFAYGMRAISILFTMLLTIITLHTASIEPPLQSAVLSQADPSPVKESNTVNILQSQGDISLSLQQAVDLYTADHPDTTFGIQTVASKVDYQVVLRSRFLSGEQVDLFHLFGHRDAVELEPFLEDLSSFTWISNVVGDLLDTVTVGDSVYGVPYSVEGMGLIANRNIFEAAGIPLADIQTFEDLTESFAQLQKQIDDGELSERFPDLEAVTEFPALDKDYLAGCLSEIVLSGQFSSPAQVANAGLRLSHTGESEQFIRLMARYGYAPKWNDYNSIARSQQVENGLATQRIAVILDEINCYSSIYTLNPSLENRLALVAVPLLDEEPPVVYYSAPQYWAINQQALDRNKEASMDFLTWLYQSDDGAEVLANSFSALSPYRDSSHDTGIQLHQQLLGYLERGEGRLRVYQELGNWGGDVFAPEIRQYLSGDVDWNTAVTTMQESW